MSGNGFFHKIETSAVLTFIGIILLFSGSVIVTVLIPRHIDPSWTQPTSSYQVQMYEISDPDFYISSIGGTGSNLEFLYHVKNDFTLFAFQETEFERIIAPPDLEKYITKYKEKELKLTSKLLLLRTPQVGSDPLGFNAQSLAKKMEERLFENWKSQNPIAKSRPKFTVYELYDPKKAESFVQASTDGILENWVDEDFKILDDTPKQDFHKSHGVIYVLNPHEFLITKYKFGDEERWRADPEGKPISGIDELRAMPLGFRSRRELIHDGEQLFAAEGCWYCHTDQTRTLVQDVVLNGSDSFPAPPSSANEYIYQKITFPGTKRNGPDLSRVGIKKPYRDWHASHFWSPKTKSKGSIMPAFQHFFDYDPRGTPKRTSGIPNYKFEAIYQYLMTKGTRITPPTQAWWQGKDPVKTIEIIEGTRTLTK